MAERQRGDCASGKVKEEEKEGYLRGKDKRKAVLEPGMERLVVPDLHAKPCTYTSAQDREPEKRRLRDAPTGVLRLVLVDAEEEESQHIKRGKEGYEDMKPVKLRHNGGMMSVSL